MLAAVLAAAANYGSKRDNEAGQAVRAVASNAIEAFNFLMTINSKYDVTGEFGTARVGGRNEGGREGGEWGQAGSIDQRLSSLEVGWRGGATLGGGGLGR